MSLETSVSAYLLRRKRSFEDSQREAEESREHHKGLTVVSLEDERRFREMERTYAGDRG